MRAETSVTSAPPTDPQTSGGVLNAQWPDGHPLRKQILLVLCLSLLAGVQHPRKRRERGVEHGVVDDAGEHAQAEHEQYLLA
jgi:hypothetical protein